MSLLKPSTIAAGYEPINGYVLEEKIGEGGFGEVWKANAPGDLKKAVKFVFGANDAKRGSRELRSLERIKRVQHPFLLALERYEVVQDRLVIVTELADGSLEDIQRAHIERGSCGIPRDILLGYLHDAADALDYLHARHNLQHLDVKPGNLLVVGGHVKVGDFGLIKDLQDCDQSIVGGLTPTYAPPELFDGRPSLNSDQYSLAVMYQELLTGTRPFNGRTIAQLATQHIHAAPNIEALPPADRVAVARALEKDPKRRFESCKEFIEALRSPRQREATTVPPAKEANGLQAAQQVEDLPELSGDDAAGLASGYALVIGLGGTGADVICQLNERVKETEASCPLRLHSVVIDTDMRSLHDAKNSQPVERALSTSTVHTPLRSANEYRRGGTTIFRSVSRRWIYNVPRSGTTEGMRPLGRLAMIDHADQIDQALRSAIEQVAKVSGDQVPSVYVVGSLSGGTGSGMVFDVISRVRTLLDEGGLEHVAVLPLLASVSLQGNPHQPLTLLDTFAASAELQHFLMPGQSYPGDEGAKWPAVPAARSPLKDAYLIVDRDHSDQEAPGAVATIVDYLWCDATQAGGYLEKARRVELSDGQPLRPGTPMIRSVGIARLKCVRLFEKDQVAPAAARRLLLQWLGHPAESERAAAQTAEQLIQRARMTPALFLADVIGQFGNDEEAIWKRLAHLLGQANSREQANAQSVDRTLISVLEQTDAAGRLRKRMGMSLTDMRREILTRLHDQRLDVTASLAALEHAANICQQTVDQLREPVDARDGLAESSPSQGTDDDHSGRRPQQEPSPLLRVARERLNLFARMMVADQFERMVKELQRLSGQLSETAVQIVHATRQLPATQRSSEDVLQELPPQLQPALEPMFKKLHERLAGKWLLGPIQTDQYRSPADNAAAVMAGEVLACAGEAVSKLSQPSGDSSTTSSVKTAPVSRIRPGNDQDGTAASEANPSPEQVEAHEGASMPGNTGQVEASEANTDSFSDVSTERNDDSNTYSLAISTQPFQSGEQRDQHWGEQTSVEAALRVACPSLLQCGGLQRLLLIVGSEAERETLEPVVREAHAGELSCTVISGSAPMLIHEAQQIPVDQLIKRLEMVSGADATVGRRLHARSDIDWNEL